MPDAFAHPLAESNVSPQRDPLAAGWEQLGNPQLSALVERGLLHSAGVEETRWRLLAARQLQSVASSPFRPNLRLHTLSASNVESTASYLQAGFDSQWELGVFGKASAEKKLAGLGTEESAIAVDAARLSLATEIVRRYVEYGAGLEARKLAGEAVATEQRLRDLMAARRQLGLVVDAELDQSEAQLLKARDALAATDGDLETLRSRLSILINGDATAEIPELATGTSSVALMPAGGLPLPAELLVRRPDLRAAALAVRKAAAELDQARAERLPQIALVGELTYASKIDGDELLTPRRIAALGPAINIPLFDWGMRRAHADARGSELAAASAGFRRAAEEAVSETETALIALSAAQRSVALHDGLVAHGERQLEQAQQRRGLGLADDLEVAQAQRALLELRAARAHAIAARDLEALAVLKCLGGPATRATT